MQSNKPYALKTRAITKYHTEKIKNGYRFEVKIVPAGRYPDLDKNPTNPFTTFSDEDRLTDLIDILGSIWAETPKRRVFEKKDGQLRLNPS